MAEDWVTDLAAFNPEVVSKACGEWRKAQTKRPTIADIRRLCIGEQSSQRAHYAVVDAQADPLAAEEAYARSVGFASALARRDAIAQREERYRKAERWRNSPESDHDPAIAGKREHQPRTSPQYSAEEMKAARKALGMEE